MNVDFYEKIWMWAAAGIIAIFLVSVSATFFGQAIQPPSHVETIDPTTVNTEGEFANPGVFENPDGGVTVVVRAFMFAFLPNEVRVPRGVPVTFRVTSPDVVHGFQIVGTNGNTMVMPGYVSQFTTTFAEAGEYLIVCNEYCGLGHHVMSAKLIVEDSSGSTGGAR
jgi:cytochrome c oxidase subunit 2